MKHFLLTLTLLTFLAMGLAFLLTPTPSAQALPEYSAQTGEPCATCHISPSGGGQRGPRGQAWVGSGKPGQVPDTVNSLEILGIYWEVDEAEYTVVEEDIRPASPLQASPVENRAVHEWLRSYPGN